MPNVYHDEDRIIYRASGLGQCIRGLVAERMGVKPMKITHEPTLRVFHEGHLHEGAIVTDINTAGEYYIETQEPQEELEFHVRDNIYIRGHIDGRGYKVGDPQPHVFEGKSMSKDVFANWMSCWRNNQFPVDEFYGYAMQITIYMNTLWLPALYVAKDRNSGQMDVRVLDKPPMPMDVIFERIDKIEEWAELDSFPFCDKPRYPCPFYHIHDETNPNAAEVPEAQDDVLAACCKEYETADNLEKQMAARKKLARDRIEDIIQEGKWEKRGWEAAVTEATSSRLDQKEARRVIEGAGLGVPMTKTTYKRVTVKRKGTGDQAASASDSPSSPQPT